MAIGTTAAIVGGLTAAGGAAKSLFGANQTSRAREAIENYDRQDLTNPYEDLQISTLGAEVRRQQAAQTQANLMDMIRMGGSRAILGAAGATAREFNSLNQDIAADLDQQMIDRNNMIAQGAFKTMQMQERREEADLAGLGRMYNVGQQNMWGGLGDFASAGMFAANNLESNLKSE